jgi:hypothetical protein
MSLYTRRGTYIAWRGRQRFSKLSRMTGERQGFCSSQTPLAQLHSEVDVRLHLLS